MICVRTFLYGNHEALPASDVHAMDLEYLKPSHDLGHEKQSLSRTRIWV